MPFKNSTSGSGFGESLNPQHRFPGGQPHVGNEASDGVVVVVDQIDVLLLASLALLAASPLQHHVEVGHEPTAGQAVSNSVPGTNNEDGNK
jgi:hypothetical protein